MTPRPARERPAKVRFVWLVVAAFNSRRNRVKRVVQTREQLASFCDAWLDDPRLAELTIERVQAPTQQKRVR